MNDTISTTTYSRERQMRWLLRLSGATLTVLALLAIASLWLFQSGTELPPGARVETWAHSSQSEDMADMSIESKWNSEGISEFSLTDQNSEGVTKANLLGHPCAVCFIFTSCAVHCPVTIQQLRKVEERTKNPSARFIAVTVDPENDTPEKLHQYAQQFGATSNRWLFLTGDKAEIYSLIQNSFQMPVAEQFGTDRKPGFEFVHSIAVLLMDETGRVLGKYDGKNDRDIISLSRALDASLEDASPSHTGSLSE